MARKWIHRPMSGGMLVVAGVVGIALAGVSLSVAVPWTPADETRRSATLEAACRDADSPKRLVSLTAIRVLGALADPASRETVARLCTSCDDATALEAAHAFCRITGDPAPLLALARGGGGEDAVCALADCAGPAVDEALATLAAAGDPPLRGPALRLFARRAPSAATPLVGEALGAESSALRIQALHAALRMPHSSYDAKLRRCAAASDATERCLALGALAHAGDEEAACDLRRAGDVSDPWDMLFVAETSAWAELDGAGSAWRKAVSALAQRERPAALSRFRNGVPAALRESIRAFLLDPDPQTRLAAAVTLGGAGDRRALSTLRDTSMRLVNLSLTSDALVTLAAFEGRKSIDGDRLSE
jgi:HEAT repeat protein